MNHKFYDILFHFLTDADACRQYHRELFREHSRAGADSPCLNTERALYELLRQPEQRDHSEVIPEMIRILRQAGLLSEIRFTQYLIIEEELQRHPDIRLTDVIRFFAHTAERNPMTEPAYSVLCNHYGEIIRALSADHDPADFDEPLSEDRLLRILSGFIMQELEPEQVVMRIPGEDDAAAPASVQRTCSKAVTDGDRDEDETEDEDDADEGEAESLTADIEFLQNFLVTVSEPELERYASNSEIIYIPLSLFKGDEVYFEDLVTFILPDRSKGVTFQIIGQGCMSSEDYLCFLNSLTDNEDRDAETEAVPAQLSLDFFRSYKALRLPCPVLPERDKA